MIFSKYIVGGSLLVALLGTGFGYVQRVQRNAAVETLAAERLSCKAAIEGIANNSLLVAERNQSRALSARVTQLEADKKLSDEVAQQARKTKAAADALLASLQKDRANEAAANPESCLLQPLSPGVRERLRKADEAGHRVRHPGDGEVRTNPDSPRVG